MYEWIVEVHTTSPHLIKALLTGLLVTTVCSVIGCFIVLKKTSFLADALAHSMLAGVVVGYLLMKITYGRDAHAGAMLIGSIISGLITVAMIGFVSRMSRVKEDAVIGIMYTGIFAFGGVLVSLFSEYVHIDLLHFIVGQLLGVSDEKLWMMAIVAVVVLVFIVLMFRSLQLVTFDRVMAASLGMNVILLDYMLTTCTAMVVVTGVQVVGVIQVVGLLIAPAATAYLLCDRLKNMLWVSAVFGWTGFLIGYFLSESLNVAPGAMIVVVLTAQFLIVFLVAPRYGLLADFQRKLRAVPQQVIEDILGVILRAENEQCGMEELVRHTDYKNDRIRKALNSMVKQEWLEFEGGFISFTEEGRIQARRLLRAHRLWETYLQHLGVAEDELHQRAHVLEHLHDEEAVDYLDDKLGHPLTDPHGKEIPEDFEHLVPGKIMTLAILREGHSGQIVSIGDLIVEPLAVGDKVAVGGRENDSRTWVVTVTDADGKSTDYHFNHNEADAICVRLD